jgi:hypothetical protein
MVVLLQILLRGYDGREMHNFDSHIKLIGHCVFWSMSSHRPHQSISVY